MPTVEIDKEGCHIIETIAGVESHRTVRWEDTIISAIPTVTGTEFKKVLNIYYNVTTSKLIVVYEA